MKIRSTRVKKFRKKYRSLIIGIQVLVIWYSIVIAGISLNTTTNAAFNDIENVKGSIGVNWEIEEPGPEPPDDEWEKSSMKEVTIGGSCSEGINAVFRNDGDSVGHELTTYEVYWTAKGNPKPGKGGELVKSGQYEIPDHGETVTITYQPTKNGVYKIRAHQEVGHPGNIGPWSGSISITDCNKTDLTTKTAETEKQISKQKNNSLSENSTTADTTKEVAKEQDATQAENTEDINKNVTTDENEKKEQIENKTKTEETTVNTESDGVDTEGINREESSLKKQTAETNSDSKITDEKTSSSETQN